MNTAVEILSLEPAREAIERAVRRLGRQSAWRSQVRFLSAPSKSTTAHRISIAPMSDLASLSELVRFTPLAIPVVVYADVPGALALAPVIQELVLALTMRFAKRSAPAYIAPDDEALRRLIWARLNDAEAQLIASAHVSGDTLEVWSCEPRLYRVALDELPALAGLSAAAKKKVSVSESGSRLHWDAGDVDLDLDSVRVIAVPAFRAEVAARQRRWVARYGRAIRLHREECGLKQNQIAGLSERQVRRLELGDSQPHSSTLQKLARAHRETVHDYLGRLAKLSAGGKSSR